MTTYADKSPENKRQPVAYEQSQSGTTAGATVTITDNRPDAVVFEKMQTIASNSARTMQLKYFHGLANGYSLRQKPVQQRENEIVKAVSGRSTSGSVVQRTIEDAIIVSAHLDLNMKLPYNEEHFIEALVGLSRAKENVKFNMLKEALLKNLVGVDKERIEADLDTALSDDQVPMEEVEDEGQIEAEVEGGMDEAVEPENSNFTIKEQTGRLYNKDNTRMIILSINEKFMGYDIHLSYFPKDISEDPWNKAYNDSYGSEEYANAQYDISDHRTMAYNEFHVTYGKGTDSMCHFFFDLGGIYLRGADVEFPNLYQHAKVVAEWSLTLL